MIVYPTKHSLEEIALWMGRMYAPPIIDEDIEGRKDDDKERGGPLGLEADSDHAASAEADQRHYDTNEIPFSLEHDTKEEEYE